MENNSENNAFSKCLANTTASGQSDPANDAVWILTSTFIIFTMQSGFGLLESGSVTAKNEVNIMVKNAIDVIVGGLTYWIFGYAFSFGEDEKYANSFSGWGYFFVNVEENKIGEIYSHFFFQSSFATTATTIVSGAMAERTKLEAYIAFSMVNTLVFCFPAHWVWDKRGFLRNWGMVDIAGDGPVHLVGGVTGLVATLMLKPRYGRYMSLRPPQMGAPTNALLGMFMLWWGWLGFNCGSTFGISGPKWKLAARSAVSTLTASTAGGCVGLLSTFVFKERKFDVASMINGILSSLVSVTGICALAQPWEGFVIGAIGATLALTTIELMDRIKVDDPVGVVGVHAVSSVWGLMSVGLFARSDKMRSALGICHKRYGLFYGGGAHLLGIQMLGALIIAVWTMVTAFLLLKVIELTIGLRMSLQHELMGADMVEHGVGDIEYDKAHNVVVGMRRMDSLGRRIKDKDEDFLHHIEGVSNRETVVVKGDHHNTSHNARLLWRVGVGKIMNADERARRKKVKENFDFLFAERHRLRGVQYVPEPNEIKKPDSFIDLNKNSYDNYGFSRDSVTNIEVTPHQHLKKQRGFFARLRQNFRHRSPLNDSNGAESQISTDNQNVHVVNCKTDVPQDGSTPSASIYI